MTGTIFHTIFSRGTGLLAGFLLVWITARYLGAEVRGLISLFTFSIALISLFSNMLGGPVLVYRASRHSEDILLKYSLRWTLLVCLITPPLLGLTGLLPWELVPHCLLPGLFLSLFNIYTGLLLGHGDIQRQNILVLGQAILIPGLLTFFMINQVTEGLNTYLLAVYITYGLSAVPALLRIIKPALRRSKGGLKEIRPVFYQGVQIQLASVFQLLSYRAAFWFLTHEAIGIFSVAAALAESVWIISKSLATIQYSKISLSRNEAFNRKITSLLLRISISGTSLLLIILLLIPAEWIAEVFGHEYAGVSSILTWLAPGILFMSAATIITHYFSGTGRNRINTFASLSGAIIALISCALLIPIYGLPGAAAATSIGYLANLLWLWIEYQRKEKLPAP